MFCHCFNMTTAYTIRPLLWTYRANQDGTHTLMIAVTINRKVHYQRTSYRLRPDQWTGSEIINYPNARLANAALRRQISDIEADIINRQLPGLPASPRHRRSRHITFGQYAREVKGDNRAVNRDVSRLTTFYG
ncbi:MAG TPA: Arm DNA-binding domain-containing protein, partial [Chitinophagaceae bacterium]|nr:Arm DNA-binding domain-containing protein [Chitinophagaceae bacterium]